MPGPVGSANENKVFTAPLAIIEINGIAIGKLRDLQFSEQCQRAEVQGIGRLTLVEVPALTFRCTFTASSYMVDCRKLGDVPDPFWPRYAKTPTEFANTIIMGEKTVNLHVYSKIPAETNNDIVTAIDRFKMAVIENCYLDSTTFQIQENQVAGKNISGRYLEPISFLS